MKAFWGFEESRRLRKEALNVFDFYRRLSRAMIEDETSNDNGSDIGENVIGKDSGSDEE